MSALHALQALLRKCDETLATLEPDDTAEADALAALRRQIAAAVGEADAAQGDLLSIIGDGSGQALRELPASAYAPGAVPLRLQTGDLPQALPDRTVVAMVNQADLQTAAEMNAYVQGLRDGESAHGIWVGA